MSRAFLVIGSRADSVTFGDMGRVSNINISYVCLEVETRLIYITRSYDMKSVLKVQR